jgi:hypothetical protein
LDILERERRITHDVIGVWRNRDGSTSEIVLRRDLTSRMAEELRERIDRQMACVDDYIRTRVCLHEPDEEV